MYIRLKEEKQNLIVKKEEAKDVLIEEAKGVLTKEIKDVLAKEAIEESNQNKKNRIKYISKKYKIMI